MEHESHDWDDDETGHLLPYALAVSFGVLGVPLVAVALAAAVVPSPSLLILIFVAVTSAGLITAFGMRTWNRRPESTVVPFGELLPWRWRARRRAERRIAAIAELLGAEDDVAAATPPSLTTLYQLVAALESKDPYTRRHSSRVERHVRRLALELELEPVEVERVCRAAALHDVGKIELPDEILGKRGQLTIEEWRVVSEHPDAGARLVAGAVPDDVADAVRHHHERWDGNGYPAGLSGLRIPLFARLIAVADTFDALTSARPYRAGLSRSEAIEIMEAEAGRQLDPRAVGIFIAGLRRRRPIALLFVPGLWRRATTSVRAATSSALATAVTTTALVTSGVVTGTPPPVIPALRPIAIEQRAAEIAVPRPQAYDRKRAEGRAGKPVRPSGAVAGEAEDVASTSVGAVSEAPASGPSPAAEAPPESADVTPPEPPQTPAPAPPASPPPSSPPPEDEGSEKGKKGPPTDPQPDKGNDCDGHGKGSGKGQATHCGGD